MSKILFIGVGGSMVPAAKKFKDMHIPDTETIVFGDYYTEDNEEDIDGYNLINLAGETSIPSGSDAKVLRDLAERGKDNIKSIIEYYFEKENED